MFAGTPAPAVPSLAALLTSRHNVLAVVTRPDAPAGRGRALRRSPVAQYADAAGVPVLIPDHPRDPAFLAQLTELAPDCCPVVAYGALVPRAALEIPRLGWVNLHFSLLPAWRGAAPVQHAVLAGDDVTGATTFLLEQGMDTGPVLGTLTEQVQPGDTSGELLERLSVAGSTLLVATLDALAEGRIAAVAQPTEGISLAPKITVADAHVDWSAPAFRVDRLVRACTPAPGAWTTLRGKRVKLGPLTPVERQPAPAEHQLAPGELAGDLVGTATTAVRLGEVRPEGRGAMAAADWLRGLRLAPGESFT